MDLEDIHARDFDIASCGENRLLKTKAERLLGALLQAINTSDLTSEPDFTNSNQIWRERKINCG
jgi:hypothetical protein